MLVPKTACLTVRNFVFCRLRFEFGTRSFSKETRLVAVKPDPNVSRSSWLAWVSSVAVWWCLFFFFYFARFCSVLLWRSLKTAKSCFLSAQITWVHLISWGKCQRRLPIQIACVRFVVNCYTRNTLRLPQQYRSSEREVTLTTFEGHVMCSATNCVPYMTYLPRIF